MERGGAFLARGLVVITAVEHVVEASIMGALMGLLAVFVA